jgi:hypothetical protein
MLRKLMMLVATVAIVSFLHPGVAFAHTTMQFTIAGDGGTGILAYASWTDDNQPVIETVEGTVEAYSADGRHLGPVRLQQAPQGRSYYTAHLPDGTIGTWRVLVQASYPGPGASEQVLQLGAKPTGFPTALPIPIPTPAGTAGGDSGLLKTALGVAAGGAVAVALVLLVARRRLAGQRR